MSEEKILELAVDFLAENSREPKHDTIANCNWMELAVILKDFVLYIKECE